MKNSDLFRNETDYPDLPREQAVDHLRRALTFPTVSSLDPARVDAGAFEALQAFLRSAYPRVASRGVWEHVDRGLLITLPGSDPSLRPALFAAHQDVVPVVPGTESRWLRPPFSGDLADGYVWGRGAMDIKQMLIAELESAEYLLGRGEPLRRTVLLAFGEDEESTSRGAAAIASLLRARGISPLFVLDEGAGHVTDAADWGAPGTLICSIGTYEKGYGDLRLRAASRGGHSSNPFRGTSLGRLAEAIADILRHPPEARLSASLRTSLAELAPLITREPLRGWVRDIDAHERELIGWFESHESLYHLVRTTVAPTMISGGAPAGNVMPQDMEAVINFRMIPEDTPEALIAHCRALAGDDVKLDWIQRIGASVPSETDSFGYRALKSAAQRYFDRLVFLPLQNRGATDARQYEGICRCVLRFGPFLEEEDVIAEGVHGTNERISVRAYLQGLRVILRLMETACAEPADEPAPDPR